MPISRFLFLWLAPLLLAGCLNQPAALPLKQSDNKLIIAAEKFCLAPTAENISSEEAYQIAQKSVCAEAGIIQIDCDCDNATRICSFIIKADQPGCQPVCLVDLKTKQAQLDLRCQSDVKK